MTKIISALLITLLFCTVSTAQAKQLRVQVSMDCDSNKAIRAVLKRKYNETVTARGIVVSGELLLLYTSPSSTPSWTVVIRFKNNLTCIMAGGDEWESLGTKKRRE